MSIKNILFVGLGGGIGAMLRYIFSLVFKQSGFPLSTLLINVVGSFFMGLVFASAVKNEWPSSSVKLFLATGICGGFTTFSAFSIENVQLIKEGNYTMSLLYIVASITFCILACFAGFKIFHS